MKILCWRLCCLSFVNIRTKYPKEASVEEQFKIYNSSYTPLKRTLQVQILTIQINIKLKVVPESVLVVCSRGVSSLQNQLHFLPNNTTLSQRNNQNFLPLLNCRLHLPNLHFHNRSHRLNQTHQNFLPRKLLSNFKELNRQVLSSRTLVQSLLQVHFIWFFICIFGQNSSLQFRRWTFETIL